MSLETPNASRFKCFWNLIGSAMVAGVARWLLLPALTAGRTSRGTSVALMASSLSCTWGSVSTSPGWWTLTRSTTHYSPMTQQHRCPTVKGAGAGWARNLAGTGVCCRGEARTLCAAVLFSRTSTPSLSVSPARQAAAGRPARCQLGCVAPRQRAQHPLLCARAVRALRHCRSRQAVYLTAARAAGSALMSG